MGDHRNNPVARANAQPRQMARIMLLGDTGIGLLGLQLLPVKDGEDFVVKLAAIGGRASDLIPLEPRPVILGEIARLKESELAALFEAAEKGESDGTGG